MAGYGLHSQIIPCNPLDSPSAVKALRKAGVYRKGDERILGDGEFVENVLARAEEDLERKYRLRAKGFDIGKVVNRVAELTGLESAEVLAAGKYKKGNCGP